MINVTEEERDAFAQSHEMFNMGITPYYASLMDPERSELPDPAAVGAQDGRAATSFRRTWKIRWPKSGTCRSRASPTATRIACSSTRPTTARFTAATARASARSPIRPPRPRNKQLEDGLAYIEAHKEIRDVVISGGDPLSNSDDRLDYILSRLRAMEHIEVFRLGTRNLVTLPQRVTDDFAQMLRKYHPVFVHTHFNHPKECTQEAFDACAQAGRRRLRDRQPDGAAQGRERRARDRQGAEPQAADDARAAVLHLPVRPVPGHQPLPHADRDRASRSSRTLRGWTSGMAVPHFVVDAPGGGGKIPLLPNYVVKHEGKKWTLRNFTQASSSSTSSRNFTVVAAALLAGCASFSPPKQKSYDFPKGQAYVNEVKRPYYRIGVVRSKVNFPSLDPEHDEQFLCRNYYNKAVADLVKYAKQKGADAVIEVRSVVFFEDGRTQSHKTPECSDDGQEGQILAEGVAVKWLAPAPPPASASP